MFKRENGFRVDGSIGLVAEPRAYRLFAKHIKTPKTLFPGTDSKLYQKPAKQFVECIESDLETSGNEPQRTTHKPPTISRVGDCLCKHDLCRNILERTRASTD